jgi:hypothetical protein
LESTTRFELRLQGGGKLFAFGLVWLDILGEGGIARIREAPGFCREPDCAEYFTEHATAFWSFWRMGDAAKRHLLDRRGLCLPVVWTATTLGAGFVSIDRDASQVNVDVCLSTASNEGGVSAFDDWNRIAKDTKNDVNQEMLLRLNFGDLRDFDLDAFKSGKRLGTTDIALEVRPAAIQFSPDD